MASTGQMRSLLDAHSIFYVDDGQLAGTNLPLVSQGFELLRDLFSRIGFALNKSKTQSMVCAPQTLTTHLSTPAYKRKLGGDAERYEDRKRMLVECPQCSATFQHRRLGAHLSEVHGTLFCTPVPPRRLSVAAPRTYNLDMDGSIELDCPVPLCEFGASKRYNMRRHFAFMHPMERVNIAQDAHLLVCAACTMRVPTLGPKHTESKICKQLSELRIKREKYTTIVEARAHRFQVDGTELEAVNEFIYLGRTVTAPDDDQAALRRNLLKARKRWSSIRRILVSERSSPRIAGLFYKATCLTILLYGSETWCWTPAMIKTLEGFHHRVARYITRRPIRTRTTEAGEELWHYPSTSRSLELAGLWPMRTYIGRRRAPLVTYAEQESTFYPLTTQFTGHTKRHFWWDQHSLFPLDSA